MQCNHDHRINREILATEIRLIGINGEQLGIISLNEALKKAKDESIDLVEISSNAEPPVCKLMNYGKFLYKKNKLIKEQKKKQKIVNIKEIKFRPNTDEGDYKIKLRNSIRFIKNGDKVKISIRFRGREITHKYLGFFLLNRVKNDLKKISIIEFYPSKIENRQMTMLLAPKK